MGLELSSEQECMIRHFLEDQNTKLNNLPLLSPYPRSHHCDYFIQDTGTCFDT